MRKAFTLIELLIGIAIFSIVIVSFITMFLTITRVQVRQSSLSEVNGQSQFLLQELQYYIGQASEISIPTDVATTTLKLRMPHWANDPTYITLSNGTVYLQQATGTAQALTSNKVTVSNLSFTRRGNAPGHDSVSIAFTVAYNTSNVEQLFSEALQTSVARASVATFDSDIIPSSTGQNLGNSSNYWAAINGSIYFSANASGTGYNVGVGPSYSSPLQTLDVGGGVRINPAGVNQPACNANARGTIWLVENAPSSNDSLKLCVEQSGGAYAWVTLY